jgi:hypothetical protein
VPSLPGEKYLLKTAYFGVIEQTTRLPPVNSRGKAGDFTDSAGDKRDRFLLL